MADRFNNNRLDRDQAHRHLEALDCPGSPFIFAVIPEAPGASGGLRHIRGSFDSIVNELDAAQASGCGVFVTINAMRGSRRLKTEVARVRAVWCERDAPGQALPLSPSMRVRTSRGRGHDYLLVDPDNPLTPAEAERINCAIVKGYGGDRNARDNARVLRLAGSWHVKREAHLVEIIGGSGVYHTRAELLAAFPEPPTLPHPPTRTVVPMDLGDRYLEGAIRGVVADLEAAVEGQRNATLNRSAFRLGQLGVGIDRAVAILAPVADDLGLGAHEVGLTIKSGVTAGAQQPRVGRAA